MIQEDCSTSVPNLGRYSFEFGNKTWSYALQLLNRDTFSWLGRWVNSVSICSSFGSPFFFVMDPYMHDVHLGGCTSRR